MGINRKSFIPNTNAHPTANQKPTAPHIAIPPEPDIWLKEWLGGVRIPILDSQDTNERFFIRALRLNQPVTFNYYGGAHPGMLRRVHPVMLYRVQGFDVAYFTGYCEIRQEIRTFRLDRVHINPTETATTLSIT
jgi:hypothetical protein